MKSVISQICPYPGPRSFNENESILFKGRDQYLEHIGKKLAEHHFILITGASGDGKSSLIFAGLIPYAKAGFLKSKYHSWSLADFRPKRNPLGNLATSLAYTLGYNDIERVENKLRLGYSALIDLYKNSSLFEGSKSESSNLIILADQFEEFFTNENNYNQDSGTAKPEAQMLVQILLETISIAQRENLPVYVICTMRSDYFGHCTAFSGFPKLIVKSQFYLERLNKQEILQAIREPAILCGYKVSERLLQVLMNEITEDIGVDMLPILQHCLYQIWKIAEDGKNEMDLLHYAMVGGYPKEHLSSEDCLKFEKWFNQLPENSKSSYKNPSLRNVLDIHANRLYDTAHNYFNENNMDKKTITKEEAQRIIEVAFKCLTKIDDRRAVRNLMSLEEITEMIGDKNIDTVRVGKVLDYFRIDGNSFIRPFFTNEPVTQKLKPKTVLDISHEALMRNWNKLEEWALKENEDAISYRELCAQLNKWLTNNKAQSNLLSAGNLIYFERWYKNQNTNLIAWLKRYIDYEDEALSETQKDERVKQHLDEIKEYLSQSRNNINRKQRVARMVTGVIVALLIFSVVALVFVIKLSNNIKMISKSIEIATKAYVTLSRDPTFAFRLAEQAYNIHPSALSKQVLMDTYSKAPFYNLIYSPTSYISCSKMSPDGKYIVASFSDKTVKLWTIEGIKLADFSENNSLINTISFSDNSKYILTGSINGMTKVWDLTGKCLLVLNGHISYVYSAVFSPDNSFILTTSEDSTARLWDSKGNELLILRDHGNSVIKGVFNLEGDTIITVCKDGYIRIWDLKGKLINKVFVTRKQINDFTISNDKKYFLTASSDSLVRLFDYEGNLINIFNHYVDYTAYKSIDISRNNNYIIASCFDNTAILWDSKGDELELFKGHEGKLYMVQFSPDGKYVLTNSDDGLAKLWNLEGTELLTLKGHTGHIDFSQFSHNGDYILTTGSEQSIRVWNINPLEKPVLKGHKEKLVRTSYSEDGKFLLTSNWEKEARLWDNKGNLINVLNHSQSVSVAIFSNDSNQIATATSKEIIIWDTNGIKIRTIPNGHTPIISIYFLNNKEHESFFTYHSGQDCIVWDENYKQKHFYYKFGWPVFSYDKKFIAVYKDTIINLYQIPEDFSNDTLGYICNVNVKHDNVKSIEFSKTSKYFITTYNDSTAWLWDMQCKCLTTLKGHQGDIIDSRFSPNDKYIATYSDDRTVKIWSFKGICLQTLKGHTDNIRDVNFSNDCKYIISSSRDNTAILWDINGEQQYVYTGHTSAVYNATFSQDGKYILTNSRDHTAHIIPILPGDVLHKINIEKVRGKVWELSAQDKEVYGIN